MQGKFIWYELLTSDLTAASRFYGDVVGWQIRDSGMEGMAYSLAHVAGAEMGSAGLMELTPEMREMGVPPNWVGYVEVDDVDAKAAEFADNGGAIRRPSADIPGIGRFAVVADPHGAALCLFKPTMPDGPLPPEPAPDAPGTFGWRELYAGDGEEAFAFYSKMFGWTKGEAMDMGALGVYQLFALDGLAIGGMMTRTPEIPAPSWGYYINVEAIDAAVERVKAAGGQVVNGPMEVPGAWIIQGIDPQGAFFALVAPKR